MTDSEVTTGGNTHSMPLEGGFKILKELLCSPHLTCNYGIHINISSQNTVTPKKGLEIFMHSENIYICELINIYIIDILVTNISNNRYELYK